jgi:hypothetical protein
MTALTFLRPFVLALTLVAAGVGAPFVNGNPSDPPTVHLVAIGDLDVGGKFGTKVAEDARNTIAIFEKAFVKAGKANQLKTSLLLGKEVTPDNVLDVIAKLDVQDNDTLVVLYSGHGGTRRDLKHVLTFRHGPLTRERLLSGMKAKNPRLMVLLTDCCSGGIDAPSVVPKYEPRSMKDGDIMEWSTVECLFLRHSGLVDLTAAEPGFNGKLDRRKPGSLFTNALLRILKTPHDELVRHLDKDSDGHLQWDEILPQLRGLAALYDQQQGEGEGEPQQAYATSLGLWMPTDLKSAK